MSLPSCWERCR